MAAKKPKKGKARGKKTKALVSRAGQSKGAMGDGLSTPSAMELAASPVVLKAPAKPKP